MARDTSDLTPIETKADLVAYFASGSKPLDAFRIGTEHEKFGFRWADLAPVPYGGEGGIAALLEGMRALTGWEPILDGENIIGLSDAAGGGAISIEPGGQFELSGAPLETLHQTCREANGHLAQVREVADRFGVGFLGLGVAPVWSRADMPVMPKQRYAIMTRYMPTVGRHGIDMMYRTSTIQVNLDFTDEADMVKKMRVGLALQPIATALFANSPFLDGRPNGFLSYRSEIWRDVDPDRCGPLPFAFDDGFGFEAYVDWALAAPMYFVRRDDRYIDATSATFAAFMAGRFEALPGERPTIGDWTNHLSTLFPEVRLKRFLEMRGADGGPWGRICALPALWTGLLYDPGVLDEAAILAAELSAEDRALLHAAVPRLALAAPAGRRTALEVARDVLRLAAEGLKRRARYNGSGDDERIFLAPLDDVVATGRTPAEELLAAYNGPWGGDIARVYRAYAF